jgi:hypothetical protein
MNRWSTVAIVEELEDHEIANGFVPNVHRNATPHAERTNANHRPDNQYWGSYFHADDAKLTYWGHVMIEHAAFFVPSLNRLAQFNISHTFHNEHHATLAPHVRHVHMFE